MKTKKIAAALLSASVLCSMGASALAAETQKDSMTTTAEMQEDRLTAARPDTAQSVERGREMGTITAVETEENGCGSVTIKKLGENGDLVLNVDADTIVLDSATGNPTGISQLKAGDEIYAFHSPAVTMSLPPQTYAEAIVYNIPEDGMSAMLHTVKQVEKTGDKTSILVDDGSLYIHVDEKTRVTPLRTKNIVSLEDIQPGDRIFAWYSVVLESYPAQAYTDKLVLIPDSATPDEGKDEVASKEYRIVLQKDMVLGSQKAVVKNGVVMVPMRAVAEALGCSVSWNEAEQAATMTNRERTMTMTIGKDSYVSAAAPETGLIGMTAPETLGCAPYVDANYRTWIPAKAFEVMVGYTVTMTDSAVEIQ